MPEKSEKNLPNEMQKEQSHKEQRIRNITQLYYSRPDIQKAVFDFSANREVVPRYFEGFGKRPDSLQYPADILAMVKKGATSFHCSEELWSEPMKLSTDLNEKQLNELRTGWDLCLPDFETIFVRDKNKIRKITLKQLAEELGLSNFGRFNVPKYLEVLSINPKSYKMEYDIIKSIIIRKRRKDERVLKISVEDGKEIFVSEDHPLIVFTNEGIKQKEAKNALNNDYLLVPLKLNFPEDCDSLDIINLIKESNYNTLYKIKYKNTLISWILVEGDNYYSKIPKTLRNYLSQSATPLNIYLSYEKFGEDRNKIKLRSRKSNLIIPSSIKLDYNFGKLVGYYLSEGSIDKDRLEFSFHIDETKECNEVISLFSKVFGIEKTNKNIIVHKKESKAQKVRINSKLLSVLFKDLLGFKYKADKKEIPSWVYNTSKSFVSGLLEGYFIGDGSCIYEWNKKSIRIDAVSASKRLIEGLLVLCLKLGINCNLIKYPKHNKIRISGEDGIKKFISVCSDFISKKQIDFIPKEINHPSKHSMYPPFLDKNLIKSVKNRNKQNNLYRALRLNMRINKKDVLLAPNEYLKKIIENNFFPIKIKNIEKIEYDGMFYDIETAKNHNFLQGDNIFTHNCIDIDSKYIDYSKISAELIINLLKFHGVKNVGVKFSGSKGLHIIIPWKAFPKTVYECKTSDMFPEWARIITSYITEKIKPRLIDKITQLTNQNKYIKDKEASKQVMPDIILVSPRHLFRMPYSLHEKTSLASVVIDSNKISDFQLSDADPLKAKIKNFIPVCKEGEASELLMQALDWYKEQNQGLVNSINKEKKFESDFKPIKLEKLSDRNFPPCVQNMLKGLEDGQHRSLFALINLFRSVGMEKEELEKRIEEWNKKNNPQLKQGYIKSQLIWSYRKKPIMPPNCKEYYQGLGVCIPDNFCRFKNPLNYTVKKSMSENKKK